MPSTISGFAFVPSQHLTVKEEQERADAEFAKKLQMQFQMEGEAHAMQGQQQEKEHVLAGDSVASSSPAAATAKRQRVQLDKSFPPASESAKAPARPKRWPNCKFSSSGARSNKRGRHSVNGEIKDEEERDVQKAIANSLDIVYPS